MAVEACVRRNYSGLSLKEQQDYFSQDVRSAFTALRSRGMDPNEACALALRIAAGVAELPPTPTDLARSLLDAAAPLAQLCSAVTRFFANPDCLQAAFWPQQDQDGASSSVATDAQHPRCSIDFAAVGALYDSIVYGTEAAHRPSSSNSNNNTSTPYTPGPRLGSGRTGAPSSQRPASSLSSDSRPPSSAGTTSRSPAVLNTLLSGAGPTGPTAGERPATTSTSDAAAAAPSPPALPPVAAASPRPPPSPAGDTSHTSPRVAAAIAGMRLTESISRRGLGAAGAGEGAGTLGSSVHAADRAAPPLQLPRPLSSISAAAPAAPGAAPEAVAAGGAMGTAVGGPAGAAGTGREEGAGNPAESAESRPLSAAEPASLGATGLQVHGTHAAEQGPARQLLTPLVHAHDQQGQQQQQLQQQQQQLEQEAGQMQPSPYRPARPPGHTSALCSALAAGVEGLLCGLGQLPPALNPGLPRQLGVLLANPMLDGCEHHDLLGSIASFAAGLGSEQRGALMELVATYPPEEMRRLVSRLQGYISITLFRMQSITRGVEDATRLLALVHGANQLAGRRAEQAAAATTTATGTAPGAQEGAVWAAGVGGEVQGGAGAAAAAGWQPVEAAAFYNQAINHEDFNLKEDLRKWKHPRKYDFCFCQFPFMYDPASKARILQMENQMTQVNELHSALFRGLFGGAPGGGLLGGGQLPDMSPFLVLRVRRGPYLVQDTLIQINRAKETDSLKKPLKVKFIGEEGVDEGGVAKEFFQLLVRQLFNPDYGMFTADSERHLHWFRPSRLDMEVEFELVGVVIGLAIYNSHILEFQFPQVLYKKLMGAACKAATTSTTTSTTTNASDPTAAAADGASATGGGVGGGGTPGQGGSGGGAGGGGRGGGAGGGGGDGAGGQGVAGQQELGLQDLSELHPEVSRSLSQLLAMRPEEVEALGLVFQVDVEMGFGEVESVDLLPGGGDVPVTAANRQQYVDLYVRHLLQDVIEPQFAPFRRGFLRLCSGAALSWFSAQELELLVCGSRSLDLRELEVATRYEDGYTKHSEPIVWFWQVVHGLDPQDQKRLLFFVTGSDRVPIKGLAALNPPFVISRAGAHCDRLPSAHTCFNHLLMPHYNSKDVLEERLLLALQNAEGFGLM